MHVADLLGPVEAELAVRVSLYLNLLLKLLKLALEVLLPTVLHQHNIFGVLSNRVYWLINQAWLLQKLNQIRGVLTLSECLVLPHTA